MVDFSLQVSALALIAVEISSLVSAVAMLLGLVLLPVFGWTMTAARDDSATHSGSNRPDGHANCA